MFLFWFIMTTTLFTFQLQQDCLHIVRSNKAVRRFLGAIVDDLPAAQNVGSLLTPEYTIPPVDNFTKVQVDSQCVTIPRNTESCLRTKTARALVAFGKQTQVKNMR